jgi:hypothetical protein
MSSTPYPLPRPTGNGAPPSPHGILVICAYCPELVAREADLRRTFPGAMLSHGCCRKCNLRLKADLEAPLPSGRSATGRQLPLPSTESRPASPQ